MTLFCHKNPYLVNIPGSISNVTNIVYNLQRSRPPHQVKLFLLFKIVLLYHNEMSTDEQCRNFVFPFYV